MRRVKNSKSPDLRGLALTTLLAAIVAAIAASPALAATPKAESIVTQDRVTLGDVFDGVKDNAGYYLAPAPEAGKILALNAGDLLRISQAFNLGWTPGNGPQQVVIRRLSNAITAPEIESAVRQKLAAELKGQKLEAELFDSTISLQAPGGADKTPHVENLSFNAERSEFRAEDSAAGAPEIKKEVAGKVHFISRVPVLREPLHQEDIISSGDIDYIDMRSADITASMIVDAGRLVGQTPRRSLAAMKPLTAADVRAPLLIKKGDLVTMLLKNDIISVTTQGRAMDNGAAGEAIQVMNTTSKQVIDAVVTGPQAVSIKPPLNVF